MKLDIQTLASQGNAILGIRGSGKTWTATSLAEQFLEAGVPFVAFDPIGVWRYLKVPGKGRGFKVVVAGGLHGDLPLTPASAPEIVRAAMKANIPLILDLYSMELSKADWKRIVESALNILLYENKAHGLRHIFIEEAAEFCPQRVGPDQGRVYAAVEKLARMGGNASLGYTLINQRAEEVNKAVLELCDCLFLHRQKGRNSLAAAEKWLAYAGEKQAKEIAHSLPLLEAGECWLWEGESATPRRIRVPEKQSFHPDRKNPITATAERSATDVGDFVAQLSATLTAVEEKAKENDAGALKAKIRELEKQLAAKPKEQVVERPVLSEAAVQSIKEFCALMGAKAGEIQEALGRLRPAASRTASAASDMGNPISQKRPQVPGNAAKPAGPAPQGGLRRMLNALHHRPGISAKQLGVRAGLSSSSGTFATYLAAGRSNGWIAGARESLSLTSEGEAALGPLEPVLEGRDLLDFWLRELAGGAARMLTVLAGKHPSSMAAEELSDACQISHTSGTFATYLSRLRTLELIEGPRSALKASDELF